MKDNYIKPGVAIVIFIAVIAIVFLVIANTNRLEELQRLQLSIGILSICAGVVISILSALALLLHSLHSESTTEDLIKYILPLLAGVLITQTQHDNLNWAIPLAICVIVIALTAKCYLPKTKQHESD